MKWEAEFLEGVLRILNTVGDVAPINILGELLCSPQPCTWALENGKFYNDRDLRFYCGEIPAAYQLFSDLKLLGTIQAKSSDSDPIGYRENGLVIVLARGQFWLSLSS